MISLAWLDPDNPQTFPAVESALQEPAGLLAAGGDLSPERLIAAYQRGIFPWFSEDEPILWWSPDPRFVLYPDELKVSRSLSKNIRNDVYQVTMDTAFEQVIAECSQLPRKNQAGTWITQEMQQAYIELHRRGHAHSVELWMDQQLVGGIYGIHSGHAFCGESMFSKASNASKIALFYLCQFLQHHQFKLIDSQVYTEHLQSLGARMIDRESYIKTLQLADPVKMPDNWSASFEDYLGRFEIRP